MVPVVNGQLAAAVLGDCTATHDAVTTEDVVLRVVGEDNRLRTGGTLDDDIGNSSVVVEGDIIAIGRVGCLVA